jgi:F-type H+-transporting ATPase subunit epsilon
MKVEIITPKGIELSRESTQIILPTKAGEITVLPHHVPLISVLKAGTMKITTAAGEVEKEIEGGILEVGKDYAVILLKKF